MQALSAYQAGTLLVECFPYMPDVIMLMRELAISQEAVSSHEILRRGAESFSEKRNTAKEEVTSQRTVLTRQPHKEAMSRWISCIPGGPTAANVSPQLSVMVRLALCREVCLTRLWWTKWANSLDRSDYGMGAQVQIFPYMLKQQVFKIDVSMIGVRGSIKGVHRANQRKEQRPTNSYPESLQIAND